MSSYPNHVNNMKRLKDMGVPVDDYMTDDDSLYESWHYDQLVDIVEIAADEIDRLRAEVAALDELTDRQSVHISDLAGEIAALRQDADRLRWRDVAEELPQEAQEVLFVRGGKTGMEDRAKRLMHAIEGECDGLAVTMAQAVAMLNYVDAEALPASNHSVGDCRAAFEWLRAVATAKNSDWRAGVAFDEWQATSTLLAPNA